MINVCLNKKLVKKKYKELQDKYNASEEALDLAIYSWANAHEDRVRKNGIDISDEELNDALDEYFQIKSNHVYTNKALYDKAVRIYNKIDKTIFENEKQAISRYNNYVKYFGKENTVMYKTPDGKTVVRLAKPIFQKSDKKSNKRSIKVEIFKGNWSRSQVAKQTDKVFLFGDNTDDRTRTHHVPIATQAVIRGLDNAIGIDTKKDRGTRESSYFTDKDFPQFKKQVDEAIQKARESGKIIVIPEGGIGTGKAQLSTRAPKLFSYLQEQLQSLQKNEALNSENETTTQEVNLSENAMSLKDYVATHKIKGLNTKFAKIVIEVADSLGIKVAEKDLNSRGVFVSNERTIYIDPKKNIENTLLHEAVHSVTVYYLNHSDKKSLPKNIQIAIKEIEECYLLLKEDYIKKNSVREITEATQRMEHLTEEEAFRLFISEDGHKYYGLTSVEEMIAELSNKEFIDVIRDFDNRHKNDKSLFKRLVDAISSLFSTHKEYKSVEQTLSRAVYTLLSNPSKEASLRYSKEILNIKDNIKTVKEHPSIVRIFYPAEKLLNDLEKDSDSLKERTVFFPSFTLEHSSIPKGARHVFTEAKKGTILAVHTDGGVGTIIITGKAERTIIKNENGEDIEGYNIPLITLDYNYLTLHKLNIKVNDNNVAYIEDYEQVISSMQSEESSTTSDTVVKEALNKLNEVKRLFLSRIKFDRPSHTYTIYDSAEDKENDTNGHKAISVTKYIYGDIDLGGWGTPSDAIGNTNDQVIRDFFKMKQDETGRSKMKKSYPNLNKKQLLALIDDCEDLYDSLKGKHGENCVIITDEFPIAGQYTVMSKGKPVVKYMAGTMDMIVIDEKGEFHGYDMKCKRSGIRLKDLIGYGNQLGLYNSIFRPYGITFVDNQIILSDTRYEGPLGVQYGAQNAVYTVDKDGQLYNKGQKIQDDELYKAPRIHFLEEDKDGNLFLTTPFIAVNLDKNDEKMALSIEALPDEDKALIEEEFGKRAVTRTKKTIKKEEPKKDEVKKDDSRSSSITYGKGKKSSKSGIYNPLLSASERTFLANNIMQRLSFIITHLLTSKEANNGNKGYFKDGRYATMDFTTMSREEIINTIGIVELLNIVKKLTIARALLFAKDKTVQQKLHIAFEFFNDLVEIGYSKLISLEGVTIEKVVGNIIEDMGDENIPEDNDSSTLEEKEREYWQLGQRNISAKSSLSKLIRRMFERLPVLDENGKPVKDDYGFGLDTFVDANVAVNSILDWCRDCTTMEEMEEILRRRATQNPYLNTILEKIKDEPIRSLFFKNFRKDFTIYSTVVVGRDSNGKRTYDVVTINTKGATQTILSNLTTAFKAGAMKKLIITRDEVEGRGRVNVKYVEAINKEKQRIAERIDAAFANKRKLDEVLEKEAVNIANLIYALGIPVSPKTVIATIENDVKVSNTSAAKSMLILNRIGYMAKTLLANKNLTDYNPLLKEQEQGNLYSDYRNLILILEKHIEDSIEASTYENGKTYYSFVTPSYMGKLITNLKNSIQDKDKFKQFMQDNYKQYKWFYNRNAKRDSDRWNNKWLELLENPKMRQALEHKVELNFNKVDYKDLSELSYTLSLMQEYFYDKSNKWAWYRVPILSNKPSSEFVKFVRFSGANYKRDIKLGLKKTFDLEIMRIKTVLERAALSEDSGVSKISNYDIDLKTLTNYLTAPKTKELIKRIKLRKTTAKDLVDIMNAMASKGKHSGAEFHFLQALNLEFSSNTVLKEMIVDLINGRDVNESLLNDELIGTDNGRDENGAIDEYMEEMKKQEFATWEKMGLFETIDVTETDKNGEKVTKKAYKYIGNLSSDSDPEEIEAKLTEYIWNDMFATINIILLTTTDLAYYKNSEDFQKRIAQIHSPALKLNTTAEYNGVRVSDGKARTIYIKDNEVTSEIIPNVKAVFDQKIALITNPTEKQQMKMMRDLILSSFEKINVTDAQAYSSPTSYRKKMIMAGQWDDTMEEAYKRIREGNFNLNDLGVVWQPLKPFVYSLVSKGTGVQSMSTIKMPIQNKNSEYMLLIADALMRGGGKKSTLGAIFDFMEESHLERDEDGNIIKGTYRQDGIDTVQFESAVKVGLMGVIDINDMSYKEIKETLEDYVYYSSDKQPSESNEMDRYNEQFVHTIPYEDYGIQQEVPAHLEGTQAMGSQVRILSISDISEGTMFQVYNQRGEWDREHLIKRYQELHAANIRESFEKLAKDLNLTDKRGKPITDRKARNRALSELMRDAIKKDLRYGADLLRACSLDENDEFIIPPNDPIQSLRILQLINSIIKSRINKLEVQGGPVVQTSVFGTSEDLKIVFNGKDGKPLRAKLKGESDAEYQKFITENQGSLAYMEVYMPIPSAALEKALTKKDGSLMSIEEAIKAGIIPVNKNGESEMLKAIGYRIPTEDKYSMLPMKIKGFLPKAAGEAVMMPKEITLLTGSDFDIDKMYIMLKEFDTKKVNIKEFTKRVIASYAKKKTKAEVERDKRAITDWIEELDKKGRIISDFPGKHIPTLKRQIEAFWAKRTEDSTYFMEKTVGNIGKENRSTRNNEIFDIQWAVLTHSDTMSKMFNPGSFEVQKKSARIIQALKMGINKSYKELSAMNLDDLEALVTSKGNNILFSSTQVAFHKQNMTAGKLIGAFANSNTSHAFLSMQNIYINFDKDGGFIIDGHRVGNRENNKLDQQKGHDGSLISKLIASFLAAAVDAVKDPVLNFMNLNTFTVNSAMLLARLGFDSDTIGLVMSLPIIEKVAREYFRLNNDGYTSIESVIKDELDNSFPNWERLEKAVSTTDFTKEDLAKGIALGDEATDQQALVLLLFNRLSSIAKNVNTLTFITKFNSVSNSVGPTIADTLVLQERINKFVLLMEGKNPPFNDNALNILTEGSSPLLNAFYETTVGDRGAARLIFEPFFPHYSVTFKELLSLVRETTKAQLDAKTINKLMNDFILYKLTIGDNPIINSSLELRNRFINNFVKEFSERVDNLGIHDNLLVRIINQIPSNNNCPVPTLSAATGLFSADMQESVKTAWSELMDNPETFEFGRDLFIYNLYRSGFNFSPKTFLHLASVDTKLSMGEYIDAVANPDFNDLDVDVAEFLLMFRRNHSNDSRIVPELELKKNNKKTLISANTINGKNKITISYDKNKVGLESIIANKKAISTVFAPVIKYNDKLYYTEKYEISGSSGRITYIETSPLGNANNFLEYNANESAVDMISALSKKVRKPSEEKEESSSSTSDDIVNNDNDSKVLSDRALRILFSDEGGPLYDYFEEIRDLANEEGAEVASERVIELAKKWLKGQNEENTVVKKVKKIIDDFC